MQRVLSHPLTLIVCAVLTIVFFVSLDKNAQTVQTSVVTLQALDAQNQKLATEVMTLQEQVAVAQTAGAKEKIIRNELLLQKEGEYVVQLPADLTPPPIPAAETDTQTPWEAWKELLL